jgi:hypothetical protein
MLMTYKRPPNERERHLSKAQQYANATLEIARGSPDPRDLLNIRVENCSTIVRDGELQAKRPNFDPREVAQLKSDALKELLDVVDEARRLGSQEIKVSDIIRSAESWISWL